MPSNSTPSSTDPQASRVAFVARLSLICPFLVVLLAFIAGHLSGSSRLYAEVAAGLCAVLGLGCAVAALTQGWYAANRNPAIQGAVGLIIGLVFVGVVLNNYLRTRHGTPATFEGQPTVAAAGSPEVQRLSEAVARFVAKTAELEQRLAAAARPLGASPVLNLSGVDAVEGLASRRSGVEAYQSASHDLSNHLGHARAYVDNELTRRGATPDEARYLATAFVANLDPQLSRECQKRELEHLYSQTLLQALDLLQQHWGAWKPDADGTAVFPAGDLNKQYAGLQLRLQDLEERKQALDAPPPNP